MNRIKKDLKKEIDNLLRQAYFHLTALLTTCLNKKYTEASLFFHNYSLQGKTRTFFAGKHSKLADKKIGEIWKNNSWNDVISSYQCQCESYAKPRRR